MGASIKERELHELILQKDDLAFAKLFDLYGEPISKYLSTHFSRFARQDERYVYEAVSDAFLDYYENPSAYDPDKSSLKSFLGLIAKRDLINLIEKEKKHFLRIELPEDVELQEIKWNNLKENDAATDSEIVQNELVELVEKELEKFFNSPIDLTLAKMVLSKERNTEVFAEILGIPHLSEDEVFREVKRHKDRIKKVLQRNGIEQKLRRIVK